MIFRYLLIFKEKNIEKREKEREYSNNTDVE